MKSIILPRKAVIQSDTAEGLRLPFRRRWLVIGGLVLLAIGLGVSLKFFIGQQKNENKKHAAVLTVTTQSVQIKPMLRFLSTHGSITAWDPASIGATATGLEVKTILAEEGDVVKKGQLLASLDSDELKAQLESERAKLAGSVSNLTKSIQPNRPEDINGLSAAVSQAEANVGDQEAGLIQAKANLENARMNSKRYEYLKQEGAVSLQDAETRQTNTAVCQAIVEAAEKRVEAAKFALKQAHERLSMAKVGGRKEDVQIASANVSEIKANIKRLSKLIDETLIKAPVAGLITRRDAHLGDISTAGKTMFLLARDNRLELKAQVPEGDLSFIKPGQEIKLICALNSKSGTNDSIKGRVREISPLVDADSRLATVRIDIPNDRGLKAGMYAEGQINIGNESALTVPAKAIISRDEKQIVFVVHNDQVESRSVRVNNQDNEFAQISAGLKENEQVVIEGAGFLKDGDFVTVSR